MAAYEKRACGKSAENRLTELVVVLDRSGSMQGLEADMIGGYNALLESNRVLPGRANVSLVLFNDESHVVHDRIDIREARKLDKRDFRPSGCTALLDAVGDAVHHTQMVQKVLPPAYRADDVILAIATDGYENASTRYSYSEVKRLLGEVQREYGWEVLFLGANIDVAREAEDLGIRADRAVAYEASPMGCAHAFSNMSRLSEDVRR